MKKCVTKIKDWWPGHILWCSPLGHSEKIEGWVYTHCEYIRGGKNYFFLAGDQVRSLQPVRTVTGAPMMLEVDLEIKPESVLKVYDGNEHIMWINVFGWEDCII
jgi:hypothetical protein